MWLVIDLKTGFAVHIDLLRGIVIWSGTLAQWDFYVGQPKTKCQIFTCFSKFCVFISNQTYD